MTAPRKPHEEPSLLVQPLGLLTRLVVRFPKPTLALALALAVAAGFLAVSQLRLRTSRLDLLNPQSGYNRLWLAYIAEFGEEDDAVVVVDGPNRAEVVATIDQVARELRRRDRLFHDVLEKVDLAAISARRLHYLSPDELAGVEQLLGQLQPVLSGDWSGLNLGVTLGRLRNAAAAPDPQISGAAAANLAMHARNLQSALRDGEESESLWSHLPFDPEAENPFATEYFLANEGKTGLILLRLSDDGTSFDRGTQAIDTLRDLLERVEAGHAGVSIGLTGLPVMENDEMRASQVASIKAGALSLVAVACLFVAGFGGIRHPLMTVFALILALGWTFGYITLAVGHLNILSMSFGVILIGLGIDFGIHYVARYLQLRQTIRDSGRALTQTSIGVGPGIVTGGMTTAIAFFSAGLADFTGLAELGIIAGGGIVLCVIAAMVVLPAMIQLSDRDRPNAVLPRPLSIDRPLALLMKAPRLVLVVSIAATVLLGTGITRLQYDHNLLNLQPVGLESVVLEQRLLNETDGSVWFALSIAKTPEQLLERKQAFESLMSVERTEEIVSLLPTTGTHAAPAVARIGESLSRLPDEPPLTSVTAPADLAAAFEAAAQRIAARNPQDPSLSDLRGAAQLLRETPTGEAYARISRYQQQIAADLLTRLKAIEAAAEPRSPQLADLPPALVNRFVGRTGTHLLKIYSKTDIWDMDALRTFVSDVRSVDSQATGKPLQTFEASLQMQRSYVHAALYSLVAVLMILVLDFRSISYSCLAILPVLLGMLQLFGTLGLLGIPLNPANMIVLPLILGIGLDDGVHVIHDFRCQRGQYRLSRSTATAVILTSLTTMVGFGSLMIADHRGLQSLGRVLTIGISFCLFTSLVPLPALLAWVTRRRPTEEELLATDDERVVELPAPAAAEADSEVSEAVEPLATSSA
jgi:hypothetical protein